MADLRIGFLQEEHATVPTSGSRGWRPKICISEAGSNAAWGDLAASEDELGEFGGEKVNRGNVSVGDLRRRDMIDVVGRQASPSVPRDTRSN